MPDRSKVMTQKKGLPLYLRLGVGRETATSPHTSIFEKLLKLETGWKKRRYSMKKDIRVGTWNVLSAHRSGALQNLIHVTQEYKIRLLVVQEVIWLGRSITKKERLQYLL